MVPFDTELAFKRDGLNVTANSNAFIDWVGTQRISIVKVLPGVIVLLKGSTFTEVFAAL